jgi:hypothetical protein
VGPAYVFHAGYWGAHVGYYGGVHYGFGYTGVGYLGGRWMGNSFSYNQSVTNVNVTVVHNTYNETVVNNVTVNRVSYNGGVGGLVATPTAQERAVAQEPHVAATPVQRQHVQQAAINPALRAKSNGGRPAIAATASPTAFSGPGVVGAHGATPVSPTHNSPSGHTQNAATTNGTHAGHVQPSAPANGEKPPKQHTKEPADSRHHDPDHPEK